MAITAKYVESLPEIYRDILQAFWMFNPLKRPGFGVAIQSLYSVLSEKEYSLGQIREACLKMQAGQVVEIRNDIFVHPTRIGDELIDFINRDRPSLVPEFPPLQTA